MRWWLALVLLASITVGCPSLGIPPSSPEPTVLPGAEASVEAAKAALAAEKNANPSAITVQKVEAATFNDTSLGCPQPGRMYAQVITPGWIIELELNGTVYEYHATGQNAVRCDGK